MVSRDASWRGASVAGESHETLYNWVHQGHDLAGLSNVHAGYAAQGTNIQNAAHDLGVAFNALLPHWRGADADVAGASVSRFAGELFELGGQITRQADTMTDVHGATVTVQQQITAPKTPSVAESMDGAAGGGAIGAVGGPAGVIAGAITGGVIDYNNQVAAAKAAEEQARRDYQTFLTATGDAAAAAPPLALPGGISGLGEFAPPSAGAVGTPTNSVQQDSTGAASAGTATQYAGPSGVGGSVAAAQLGGGGGGQQAQAPAGTGTQFTPAAGPQGGGSPIAGQPGAGSQGAGFQGAGGPFGSGPAGGVDRSGAAPRAGGMPFGPMSTAGAAGAAGSGRSGRGVGVARSAGAGGGFGPSGSRGAGGLGGADGAGRAPAGAARSAGGVGGMAGDESAARGAGQAGGRGGMGPGMMPPGAMGRRGDDDQEHQRPDYLVEDPEVWGAGVYVSPPVIGEDPDVYQQR